MRNVDIEVFCIAKTSVDKTEVRRWLDHLGANNYDIPDEELVSDPALLVALAAKRCYLSFEPGTLNPNVTKVRRDMTEYLDNVLKSGHGCYDAATEVLTRSGWKFWGDVTNDDTFATLNGNGLLEWHRPIRLVAYSHTGKMYRVESDQVDLLVTPDHKMLACQTTTRKGRKREWESYRLVTASDLGVRAHAYIKTLPICQPPPPFCAKHALVGFAVGDANVRRLVQGLVLDFHLRRARKIMYLRQKCADAGYLLEEFTDKDLYRVTVPADDEKLFDVYDENSCKRIPVEVTEANGPSLLDGLVNSDGSVSDTCTVYDTTSKTLADQVQVVALMSGFAANISQAECYSDRSRSFGDKPVYRLTIVQRALRPEVNKYCEMKGSSYWIEDWEGEVFCAEVPNNTLYVRRNGKPVWSGNSVLEHACYSFAIEGISRVFTGEMNRHRAGVGISEGSMRYIRYRDIPYWLPTSITLTKDEEIALETGKEVFQLNFPSTPEGAKDVYVHPDVLNRLDEPLRSRWVLAIKKLKTQALFIRHFATTELNYAEGQEIWKEELAPDSKFHGKKQVTSMLRRIIPMGVATGGVWTMNLRAVRHIIALRASEAAEEEIAYVFGKIAKFIVDQEPMLMGDFAQDENGFWTPKYKKV